MNRKQLLFSLAAIFLIAGAMFLVGCPSGDDDDSDKPAAVLRIYANLEQIPWTVMDSSGRHYWYYHYYVKEVGGIGAQLTAWTYEMFSADGQLIGSGSHSVNEFVQMFTGCNPTSNGSISALGVLCSLNTCASSGTSPAAWYSIDTMTFTDTNGNEVVVSGTFNFSAGQ